jgi:hypothetical protein
MAGLHPIRALLLTPFKERMTLAEALSGSNLFVSFFFFYTGSL